MKLRTTIYPLALIIAIPLVLVVFYILNQGKFEKPVENQLSTANAQGKDGMIEYDVKWKGLGKPIIHKVTFSGAENLELTSSVNLEQDKANNEIVAEEVKPGIYELDLNEAHLANKQFIIKLKNTAENEEAISDLTITEIRYKTFGIIRNQPFENE